MNPIDIVPSPPILFYLLSLPRFQHEIDNKMDDYLVSGLCVSVPALITYWLYRKRRDYCRILEVPGRSIIIFIIITIIHLRYQADPLLLLSTFVFLTYLFQQKPDSESRKNCRVFIFEMNKIHFNVSTTKESKSGQV